MKNNIVFGTDGWRGLTGPELNNTNIELAAQAFADYLKRSGHAELSAAVGYDGRKSSDQFAALFAQVLSGNGITVYLSSKIIPTPVLSYYVKANSLSAGVMITASHNPPEYNGVKFKADYGGPFLTEETIKVEKLLGCNPPVKNSLNINISDMTGIYIKGLEKFINFDLIRKSGVKILIDSMAGAGMKYLEEILAQHGCPSETIFGKAEHNFAGRMPEPIEKNLGHLQEKLRDNPGFSFGAATDGDADRCGILLENGDWLSAQYTILLLNDYIVNSRKTGGHLVKTSSVTDKIRMFESSDRNVFDVQVGFKYITEKMISEDIAIGCEESGGFGYKGHIPERDGLLSALLFAEMLAASAEFKLSDYLAEKKKQFGEIFYDRIDLKYTGHDRKDKLPELFRNPPDKICESKITGIDEFLSSRGIVNGVKIRLEGNSRWLLLRSSETEPIIRIYAEGESLIETAELLSAGKDLILNNTRI